MNQERLDTSMKLKFEDQSDTSQIQKHFDTENVINVIHK